VDGQIVELLDQPVRADGRSGNVSGELTFTRYRVGLRLDGLRQQNWPAQVYFIGGAVFATTKVAIDTVDYATPGLVPAPGGGRVDLGGFEDSQVGFMGRIGMEYRVAANLSVNLGFTYEVFEPPPGTNSNTAFNGGLTYRI
jgi:opacity protein-like surface antigen